MIRGFDNSRIRSRRGSTGYPACLPEPQGRRQVNPVAALSLPRALSSVALGRLWDKYCPRITRNCAKGDAGGSYFARFGVISGRTSFPALSLPHALPHSHALDVGCWMLGVGRSVPVSLSRCSESTNARINESPNILPRRMRTLFTNPGADLVRRK
jgi:hypothetical protein